MIFKDILVQRKHIFTWEPTFFIVLVNGMRHLNSLFPLTIRFRTWLTSFQPGMLHGLTGNPESHSIFPPRPILREGKRYSECSTVCIFSFQSPPVFPRAAKKSQLQSPFSFLPRQSRTTVAIWVVPNQLAKRSVHLTATRDGEGGAGEDRALSGVAAFGQAAIWPSVCACPQPGSGSVAARRDPPGGQKALGAPSSAAAPLQRDDESRSCFPQVRSQAWRLTQWFFP